MTITQESNRCPSCKGALDAATHVTGGESRVNFNEAYKPKPGDFTVCMWCGLILRFTDHLFLREIEDGELSELDPETARLLRVISALAQGRKRRREMAKRFTEGRLK